MTADDKKAEEKKARRMTACKFVGPDDTDARNDILFKEPETIAEWTASIERCMEIVEERMDSIERRIVGGEAAKKPDEKDGK